MRFFRLRNNFNWKYIIGELLLIFFGISLAIWFNNWNSSMKSMREIEIAIAHIREELHSNIEELKAAGEINEFIPEAYSEYSKIYDGKTTELITTPQHLYLLQIKYPGFFTVSDSVKLESGLYRYVGSTYINLELAELNEIAWETTRSTRIANELNYECLYDLESTYSLQRRVQKEIDKAANALQKGEFEELVAVLKFMEQLNTQLRSDYKNMLETIDDCR